MYFTDYPPGTPVWVFLTRRRAVMGRVVQTYRADGNRPSVLIRLAEDYGAYRRGGVAAFSYLKLRRRDVDRRKERS